MHLFSITKGKYSLSGIFKVPVFTKTYFQRISALEFVSSKGAAGSPCMLLFHCLQCSGKAKEKMLQISKPILHYNLNLVDTSEVQWFFWMDYTG